MSRATVVQGEASESDDEPEIVASLATCGNAQVLDKRFGVRVTGEASESEDETTVDDDVPSLIVDTTINNQFLSNSDKEGQNEDNAPASFYDEQRYNTLLHKKLKEKNAMFHKHVIDTAAQVYITAAKDMYNTTQQLWKLQNTVQDVSYNMRSLTNDLFYLEDRIDIIATCNLLPTINI